MPFKSAAKRRSTMAADQQSIASQTGRWLLPLIVLAPILMSALSLWGLQAGLYSPATGFALASLTSALILGVVVWSGARALDREEERFRASLDSAPVGIIMVDDGGTIRLVNQLALSMLRCEPDTLLGRSIEELVPARYRATHVTQRNGYLRAPERRAMGKGRDLYALRQDGTEFPAEIGLNPVRMAGRPHVVAAIVDITERVEANLKIQRLNRIHSVLSGINTLIVRARDRETLFREATRIAVEEGELPAALVVQHDRKTDSLNVLYWHGVDERLRPDTLSGQESRVILESLSTHRAVVRNELERHREDDDRSGLIDQRVQALASFPLSSEETDIDAAFVLYRFDRFAFDETEMRLLREVAGDLSFAILNLQRGERLEYLTHFDSITDLPNRFLMNDRLSQAMLQADNQQGQACVLFVDIDRFKQINDSLGHAAGDAVLRLTAQRIRSCLDNTDTVSRWGGDEFLVLLPNRDDSAAAQTAHLIAGTFDQPIVLEGGHELFIACSIGIAEYPRDGRDIDALVNSAATAMATIKEYGGNSYQRFRPDVDQSAGDRLALETSLRLALQQDQFRLVFQPQVDLGSGKVLGFEALLRWQHPTRGMVAPDRFIPLAEETGLIIPIGEWVLRTACRLGSGLQGQSIAVNLSARQFHQHDLVAMIRRILEETGMCPGNLELEITESALMFDLEAAVTTLSQLAELGVRISLDDFGTGYSSLSYLQRFPIDTIKIDRSFIAGMESDASSDVIVNAIIAMAHSLGLRVIAEGVETEAQREILLGRGCDQAQGYLFSRPLPFDQVCDSQQG